jgi:hypothetical protein
MLFYPNVRTAAIHAAPLIVCDNSREGAVRRQIERLCHDRGCPIPACLSTGTRSVPVKRHRSELVFYNLLQEWWPIVFGVLDHDLIPPRPLDLAALVADQPVYGLLSASAVGLESLGGFLHLDFTAIADRALDFNDHAGSIPVVATGFRSIATSTECGFVLPNLAWNGCSTRRGVRARSPLGAPLELHAAGVASPFRPPREWRQELDRHRCTDRDSCHNRWHWRPTGPFAPDHVRLAALPAADPR